MWKNMKNSNTFWMKKTCFIQSYDLCMAFCRFQWSSMNYLFINRSARQWEKTTQGNTREPWWNQKYDKTRITSYANSNSPDQPLHLGKFLALYGSVKWKSALQYVQNVRIHIIQHMHKVLSGPLLSIDTFSSLKWFRQRTGKALIRLRKCAVWFRPWLSTLSKRHIFAWHSSYGRNSHIIIFLLPHKNIILHTVRNSSRRHF